MTPQRIQWSRFAGATLPPNAKLVTRATRYGNPFPGCEHRDRDQSVDQFAALLARNPRTVDPAWLCPCNPVRQLQRAQAYPTTAQIRAELAGYDLACACAPGKRCHGDPLITVANRGAL